MKECEMKIVLDGKEKTIKLGRITMGIQLEALDQSQEPILDEQGKPTTKTNLRKAEIRELIASQVGDDKITFEDFLRIEPKHGGALKLYQLYKDINYGGDLEREKFQEDSLERKKQ